MSENWRDALPEDLQNDPTLSRYNSLEDMARGHLETKSQASQSLRIPPQEAGAEARQEFLNKLMHQVPELIVKPQGEDLGEFYQTMGKPQDERGYENPENLVDLGEVEAEIRNLALKANLTQDQYQSLIGNMSEMHATQLKAAEEARDEAMAGLKGEWGMAYEERMSAAQKINEELFPGVPFDALAPEQIKGLYETSKRLVGSGQQAASQHSDPAPALTPNEAMRRATEIMQNPEYWDRSSPNQPLLMEQHRQLLIQAGHADDLESMRAPGF